MSLDNTLVSYPGLTSVCRDRLPAGTFDKMWSEEALKPPPPLPKDASWSDQMRHRNFVDELERRVSRNAQIKEQRDEWWKTSNNLLFTLITQSMEKTAPGLRQLLRERFHVGIPRCG